MKKSFIFSIIASLTLLFSQQAHAQVIVIIDDGPDTVRPVPPPAPIYRAPVRRAPVYTAPVRPAIPAPPARISSFKPLDKPLTERWSLGYVTSSAVDGYSDLTGGYFSLQYMFSRHFAIEGTIGGFSDDYDESSLFKTDLSAVWYPGTGGLTDYGFSWYVKGGLSHVAVSQVMYDRDYYDDYYYTDRPSGETDGMQIGSGIVWKPFRYLSFKVETTLFLPTSDTTDNYDSPIWAFSFGTAIHF